MGRTYDTRFFFHGETDDAIKVSVAGDADKEVWLPKSQIRYYLQSFQTVHVNLPAQLFVDKGLDGHVY